MAILNSVVLHQNNPSLSISNPPRRYTIVLNGHINQFFPPHLTLTILFNNVIQMCSRILVHTILVYSKDLIIGGHESLSRKVSHYLYVSVATCIFLGTQWR